MSTSNDDALAVKDYFNQMFGKDVKLVLPASKFKGREEVSEIMSRAQEASKLFFENRSYLKKPDTKTVLIHSMDEALKAFTHVYKTKICCYDTETTGFDHYSDTMVSFQISPEVGISYYFPFAHVGYEHNLPYDACMEMMAKINADPTILKIGHNIKFDYKWWLIKGYPEINNVRDTMIMSYILNENRECGHGLKELTEELLRIRMIKFSELGIWEKRKVFKKGLLKDFSELSVFKALEYACPDTDMTLRLYNVLWAELKDADFLELFEKIETPLVIVLAKMELAGVKVDAGYFKSFHEPFQTEITNLTLQLQKMAEEAGFVNEPDKKGVSEPFNPASNPQMVKLVELLGLTTNKWSKKTGKMSVDKKGRAKLADKHPAFKLIDSLNERTKALNTYLIPLSTDHLNPVSGRVHTSFHQHVTDTGRLSSSHPNLQNVSKKEAGFGTLIRKGFIPESGYLFVRADYSQIELKIAAHMSKCQPLLDAFINGEDIHSTIAVKTFKLDIEPKDLKNHPDKEIRAFRDKAKAISFGLLYGVTEFGLSKNLGISMGEAKKMIDDFYATFPELGSWIKRTIQFGYKMGYVQTLMRRRRRFVRDINGQFRFGVDRAMQNCSIQGTSADLTKWAMVQLDSALTKYEARMILTVHDEIIIECKEECVEDVAKLMQQTMEEGLSAFKRPLMVPTTVELEVQSRWGVSVTKCSACGKWSTENKKCAKCGAQL